MSMRGLGGLAGGSGRYGDTDRTYDDVPNSDGIYTTSLMSSFVEKLDQIVRSSVKEGKVEKYDTR